MPAYLPRELGESGALRAVDAYVAEDRKTRRTNSTRRKGDTAVRNWQLAEQEARAVSPINISARLLRQINQQRFDASLLRHHRPARVS